MCWWCSWWSARGCQGFHKEAWWEWDQVHKTWQMHCWLFLRQRYILSNGVGNLTSQWCHFWFTSQHQSDLNYITHNSGSHYYFYYRSHQHTRTWNKNIYIAIKDYPEIRVWSYLPQVDTVSPLHLCIYVYMYVSMWVHVSMHIHAYMRLWVCRWVRMCVWMYCRPMCACT